MSNETKLTQKEIDFLSDLLYRHRFGGVVQKPMNEKELNNLHEKLTDMGNEQEDLKDGSK